VTDREAGAIARAVAKVADVLERVGMLDAAGDADLAFCPTFGEDVRDPLLAEEKFQVLREVRREGCTSRPAISRALGSGSKQGAGNVEHAARLRRRRLTRARQNPPRWLWTSVNWWAERLAERSFHPCLRR
jgi:hypothetical protein